MSQYPTPYQTPQPFYPGYAPYPDPLAPARRAGIAMIVLGILAILLGGCFAIMGTSLPKIMSDLPTEQRAQFDQAEAQFGVPVSKLFLLAGVITVVVGILYVVLGAIVRGGRKAAVICAMILTGIALAYMLFNTIGALFMAGGAVGACGSGAIMVLLAIPLIWLIPALRSSAVIDALQAQHQAQMWQYQQMQQMYGQGGAYGYPQQPPPPPPEGQPPQA